MGGEEIIRLVISFFGGGLVAGILAWLRAAISERKSRQIDYLNNQIRNLYGPLFFFVSLNENLFKLNDKFHVAYPVFDSNRHILASIMS